MKVAYGMHKIAGYVTDLRCMCKSLAERDEIYG